MRRVYIVLSTTGVGGAEKRFTDNWHALRTAGMDIHLVMDQRTLDGLRQQSGMADMLAPSTYLHALDLGNNRHRTYCERVGAFFDTQPDRAIVHYPLAHAPGVQARHGHRLVMSWVNSAMPPFANGKWRIGVGAWLAFLAADHIDVLNPNNLAGIRRVPGMARKSSLTAGGTQIDSSLYKPAEKSLDLVFLGRTEPEKQSLRFVRLLPEVHRLLHQAGHRGYRFVICGDGAEAAAIRELITTAPYRGDEGVPMQFGYSAHPEQVLGRASVYFSLQRTSNYPSKALAEAMACGAFPLMTEVGETAMMVEGLPHHGYVPRDFGAGDLFEALHRVLSQDVTVRDGWSREISAYAAQRFAKGRQAAYFADIYRRLGATG